MLFDSEFILCTGQPEILGAFKQCKQTLSYSEPLSPDVSSYITRLTTEEQFCGRMNAIHAVSFLAQLSEGKIISLKPRLDASSIAAENRKSSINGLADIFPEPEAAPFIEDLERFYSIAAVTDPSGIFVTVFHTKPRDPKSPFHMDDAETAVKTYTGGMRLGPFEAFDLPLPEDGNYWVINPDLITTAQPGQIFKPKHPHAEGGQPGKLRFSAVARRINL